MSVINRAIRLWTDSIICMHYVQGDVKRPTTHHIQQIYGSPEARQSSAHSFSFCSLSITSRNQIFGALILSLTSEYLHFHSRSMNAHLSCAHAQSLSYVQLFATPWTVAINKEPNPVIVSQLLKCQTI